MTWRLKSLLETFYIKYFPEERLLEMLCGYSLCQRPTKKLINQYLLNQRINWKEFTDLVINNHLIPIVIDYFNNSRGINLIPSFTRQKLEHYYLTIQYINKFQNQQFFSILSALSELKIDFLVMKGYLFDNQLFKKEYYRARCDLDLLVPMSQFEKISVYLLQTGFRYYHDHYEKKGKKSFRSGPFYKPNTQEIFKKKGLLVEIHTSIVDYLPLIQPALDEKTIMNITNYFFSHAQLKTINGYKIKVFSDRDLLLSSFLHNLIQHNLQLGIRLHESAQIIRKLINQNDWIHIWKFISWINLTMDFTWFLHLLFIIYPSLFSFEIKRIVNKHEEKLCFYQLLVFYFMRYKVFHPTNFPQNTSKEKEKEWCWAIIDKKVLSLFAQKIFFRFKRILA